MPFCDELRDQGLQLPGNRAPPPLFDFKPQGALARPRFLECAAHAAQRARRSRLAPPRAAELFEHPPSIRSKLTPEWFKAQQR